MRYLMLIWADADATAGGESDFQAWAEFDAQVKAAGDAPLRPVRTVVTAMRAGTGKVTTLCDSPP